CASSSFRATWSRAGAYARASEASSVEARGAMSSGIMQANVNQLALRNRSGAVARDEAQAASSAFEAKLHRARPVQRKPTAFEFWNCALDPLKIGHISSRRVW